jgi:hypothetical protein
VKPRQLQQNYNHYGNKSGLLMKKDSNFFNALVKSPLEHDVWRSIGIRGHEVQPQMMLLEALANGLSHLI